MSEDFDGFTRPVGACWKCGADVPGARMCDPCNQQIEREIEARKQRDESEALAKRLEASGLPPDYRTGVLSLATFEARNERDDAALDFVSRWANGRASSPWAFIFGNVGTRKTGIAASALREMIVGGGSGLFVSLGDLLSELKASVGRQGESENEIIARYRRARGLVIDDLGIGNQSAFTTEALYRLLNYRYEWKSPTLFTSNLKLSQLGQHFSVAGNETTGERIVDRIRGLSVRLELSGESFRARHCPRPS